ncbi:hypothetical protein QAD02_023004 [Eretmocerus hayati]|uniref:Uncharacterized protein n=1 Tax=Eretmocerus hayati TaxID=131215 RepID=A0ACC2PZH8_9HYME|nr:hypothetical protein QAD02_023004 [Eretmocerus hayati]
MDTISTHMQRDASDDMSIGSTESPLCQSNMDCDSNMSLWLILVLILLHGTITISTLFGNVLVILSVFTYKPLRIVQNFFIVSLAVADLAVGLLVMPFNIAYFVLGKWIFGIHVCKLWLTCDVLCCTASILNLCTIALDRYWAINDPINYAQKRTLDRVLIIIAGTWVISMAISSPPLLGWNDWPERLEPGTPCQLTRRKGYVIYSAIGSFWAPLAVMSIVYLEIFSALRKRAKAKKSRFGGVMASGMRHRDNDDIEDSGSSETNHNERSTHKPTTGQTSLIDDDRMDTNVGTTPPKASGKFE